MSQTCHHDLFSRQGGYRRQKFGKTVQLSRHYLVVSSAPLRIKVGKKQAQHHAVYERLNYETGEKTVHSVTKNSAQYYIFSGWSYTEFMIENFKFHSKSVKRRTQNS